MSAQSAFALRPYLPADAAVLAEIFRASIEELTEDDYDAAQRQAWASAADDGEAFARRLASRLTLVVTEQGSPVGFAALENNSHIDMLYVDPRAAGQGVGTLLCDALERLAAGRGQARLTTDASDTARPFFEKRGFRAERRNTRPIGDVWLANTTMSKQLAAASAGARS